MSRNLVFFPARKLDTRAEREILGGGKFVYVMQAGCSGPVKIGIARDPFKRLGMLQVGCSEELRLIIFEDLGEDAWARETELALHQRLARYRIRGEWFHFEGDVVACLTAYELGASLVEIAAAAGELAS